MAVSTLPDCLHFRKLLADETARIAVEQQVSSPILPSPASLCILVSTPSSSAAASTCLAVSAPIPAPIHV